MPIFLKAKPDMLVVTMGKLSSDEFKDALARLKSVPGRNWDPPTKENQFPKDADTALRLMQMLQPVADAESQALVRNHAQKVAEALVTKLPEDAESGLPYADDLRPYQRSAIAWLQDHPKSILADEMGLGKTVQAIGTVQQFYLSDEGELPATLVVCPNAVRGTWEREFGRWAEQDVQVIDGKTAAKRRKQLETAVPVVVVNWEKLRLMPELARVKWSAVIADEAHRAKNREAQQTQALWKLTAPVQLALTGTPIMNHPGELWSILRWLKPEQFADHVKGGGYWPFHYSYVDEYQAAYGTVVTGVRNPDQLRFLLSDKLVRRMKKKVLKELPDKLPTQVIEVELSAAERKLYEEVDEALMLDMAKFVAENDDITMDDLLDMPLEKLKGLVPNGGARMAKLRQITAGAKVRYAVELIRDEPETPVAAFTWHVPAAQALHDALEKGKPKLRVGLIAGQGGDANATAAEFQAGDFDHIVCTIAKGGVGLDMYRSSHPLMVEEDWVPSNNDQAIDRTHRFGQKNAVTPRVLRVPGTIDTGKIAPANALKSRIATQVLGDH